MYWKQVRSRIGKKIVAGEAIVIGNTLYVDSSSVAYKADANEAGEWPTIGLAENNAAIGEDVGIVQRGILGGNTYSVTVGGVIYLSASAGLYNKNSPAGANDQIIGVALSATEIEFDVGSLLKL